jgi:serine/threonine-protein kinase
VLYELLAGQPPFDGPNSRAILARHAMEQVPSIRIVRQSVPEELEDAVLQALEKTPADRFQKMSELADMLADLEPTLATRRTTSRGVPTVRRSTSTKVQAVKRSTPVAILGEKWGTGVRLWSISAALLAILAVGGFAGWRLISKSGASAAEDPSSDKNRIAVLYFENRSGADSLSYLADGLTEALIQKLGEVKPLQVISRNGVAPFRNSSVAPDSIGRALDVGTLVEGTIAQSGERLRVSVSLLNAGTGEVIGSRTLERPREEIFALQDDLANEVSIFLRERIGQEIAVEQTRVGTSSTKAWELLQQARNLSKDFEPLLAAGDTAAAGRRLNQADSLLAAAEKLDPQWGAPHVARGWLAYYQMDLASGFDKPHYAKWIERGMKHAAGALAINPTDPDALELRGTLEYQEWILNLEPDQDAAKKLLGQAEADLRATVTAKKTAAWAWSWLSHLLLTRGEPAEAKLAAQRSYEADPYQLSAKQTLYRLFGTSFDLDDQVEARHWCEEGQRRFPDFYRFTECQIYLMAMKGQTPDIEKAWQLLDRMVEQTAPNLRESNRLYGQMLVALVLARAGLGDSARAVAVRARGDATTDPTRDQALYEALVRTQLGDHDEAMQLLSTYVAANPQMREGIAKDQTWILKDLRADPRFIALFGTAE